MEEQNDTPCKHEPDWFTVTHPEEARSDDYLQGVVDVICKKCGASGSLRITPDSIQWD